jgi:hypothetical protein
MIRESRLPRVGLLAVGIVVGVVGLVGCGDDPVPSPPSRPPVSLAPFEVTGVGEIVQGGTSPNELVLHVKEAGNATIGTGPGSFQVTLTDHAGLPDTIGFAGTPSVSGPGSLGATASLTAPDVLTVNIVDSDTLNIESITITGLGIRAEPAAALGSINAAIGGCSGSLAGCTATNVLASPGSVVAAP